MWRKLPSMCSLACAFTTHRRLSITKRCFRSTTSVLCSEQRVSPAHPTPSQHPQDDFFVDVDSLAGLGEATEVTGSSKANEKATTTSRRYLQSTSVNTFPQDELGVIRHIPEEEGARYSRLQIPLPAGEDERAVAHVRSNTRVALQFGEEARYADESTGPTEEASTGKEDGKSESVAGGATGAAPYGCTPALEKTQDEDGHDDRLPDPARLPYDDERFAEMLLEMEVNGVVDETWQDANKAHLEDAKEIANILRSLKVRDICCIDVSEKTSNFDYIIFGTCEGARHIHLAAWAAQDADKVHRISKIKRKQTDELWEVVPIGRIVLNLMVESFREEMTLERKWAVTRTMDPLAAANAPISEGRQVKAHGLWTLTLNLQDLEDFEVDYCKDILMRQM